jgi:hypothetical protein
MILAIARPRALRFLLAAIATIAAEGAQGAPIATADTCRLYGYVPHTRDYASCRLNVRHYWSAGPCSDARFASIHRRYCHLTPTIDF